MPAYNEERSIAKVILNCSKHVERIVVVDDGSKDATADIAEALGVYLIRHKENYGYGASLRDCFNAARDLGADQMVILDSDGQHDPSDIPKLLKPLKEGADIVIGSRFYEGNGQNIPFYRKIGMRILDSATNFVGGIDISDTQSGFRAYGIKAIEKLNIVRNDFSAGSEILLQAKKLGLTIKEADIYCRYDIEKTSKANPLNQGMSILWLILMDMEFRRPLYYFTIPGILFILLSFILGLRLVHLFFFHGASLAFGPTLLMLFLVLTGIFMVLSGIILHSISKTGSGINKDN
jgi:glycosyltransferase involved in cell wall biosynthesis